MEWRVGRIGGLGEVGAGQGEPADGGRDFQGAGNLAQGHVVQLFVPEALQETLSGRQELLCGVPFLLTETIETLGPVGNELALGSGLVLGVFLE